MIKTYQLRHDALLLGLPSSAIGQHVAILDDFNPETDEVVIVKRDAKRAWIENSGGMACAIHWEHPKWMGATRIWVTETAGAPALVSGSNRYHIAKALQLNGINANNCIEFVAVKTHRPPETKPDTDDPYSDSEPIPPDIQEKVSEIMRNAGIPETDEAKVKRVCPDAVHMFEDGLFWIESRLRPGGCVLSWKHSQLANAWSEAAVALDIPGKRTSVPPTPKPPNPARFGITVLDAAPSAIGGVG